MRCVCKLVRLHPSGKVFPSPRIPASRVLPQGVSPKGRGGGPHWVRDRLGKLNELRSVWQISSAVAAYCSYCCSLLNSVECNKIKTLHRKHKGEIKKSKCVLYTPCKVCTLQTVMLCRILAHLWQAEDNLRRTKSILRRAGGKFRRSGGNLWSADRRDRGGRRHI